MFARAYFIFISINIIYLMRTPNKERFPHISEDIEAIKTHEDLEETLRISQEILSRRYIMNSLSLANSIQLEIKVWPQEQNQRLASQKFIITAKSTADYYDKCNETQELGELRSRGQTEDLLSLEWTRNETLTTKDLLINLRIELLTKVRSWGNS